MRTFAVINQKGGCGKTTTAINLAAAFASLSQRVLLVDTDPQSHCALGLAVPEHQVELHIGDALLADDVRAIAEEDLIWQITSNLDLIPSTVALAGIERKLAEAPDRDLRLARLLSRFSDRYDTCIIDCPPSIGLLTFNALRAAHEVIIPVEAGYFALKGAAKQWATIRAMSRQCGHAVCAHVLPTMYDTRIRMGREILNELARQFGDAVLPVAIHYTSKLKEAASFGQPIGEYDPASRGSQDYEKLAKHLLTHRPEAQPVMQPAAEPAQVASVSVEHKPPTSQAQISASSSAAPMRPTDRATELVQRARALAARTARLQARLAADPQVSNIAQREQAAAVNPERREKLQQKLARLYGVQQTEAGVVFVQPANGARRVAVAGDFNNWQPAAAPLRRNDQLGVWEICIKLPPGRYRYRLMVDDRWTTDQHNTYVESNDFGELNNVVEIA